MRTIKDAITAGSIIPTTNHYYNSDDWYVHTAQYLDRLLSSTQGTRELFDEYKAEHTEIVDAVDDLFMFNTYKYRHLWKLYTAEYNPLWNVDGTEKTIRERLNTGTQENKLSGKDSLEYFGSEKDSHTGHDDVTQTGSVTDTNSGNITSARTTFDSHEFADTDKDTDSRSTTTTFNSKKDQSNYNSDMTHSFTGRKDETSFGKTDTRTDNLTEHEEVTYIRGGNIGVTMTTQLETDEVNFVNSFHFLQTIVSDIANHISYVW